jgi:signal transduction histidine kinase/phage shock protein PspC (stress-responsive transcriptional regulator)
MTRDRRGLFARSRTDRVALGVAGGLAETAAVDAFLVRLAFGALTVASGMGIVLYLVAWSVSFEPQPHGAAAPAPLHRPGWRPTVALGCIVLGSLLVLRDVGIWFGDSLVWPLLIAGCGSAVIWFRSDAGDRARWTAVGGRLVAGRGGLATGSWSWLRMVVGGFLVLAGMTVLLFAHQAASAAGTALLAAAVTAGGLGLIITPWVLGLAREASAERRERIRSEERAEIAAHLHDSVLNTLALIQRGDVPAEVASVARRQERELRAWLNGRPIVADGGDLRATIDAVAGRVEEMHHVPVDTVVVGELVLDDAGRAVALACQEAAINAARHSGAPRVSIYVEAEPHEITAYVRDQGRGFDRDTVPADRRGISESIIGRMRRLGGSASITSRPGAGTEVQMRLPRSGS